MYGACWKKFHGGTFGQRDLMPLEQRRQGPASVQPRQRLALLLVARTSGGRVAESRLTAGGHSVHGRFRFQSPAQRGTPVRQPWPNVAEVVPALGSLFCWPRARGHTWSPDARKLLRNW